MNAIILSIGDELALGQTVDTNSAWMSRQLAAIGCDVIAHVTVSDAQSAIEDALTLLAPRAGLLVVSGGLGPTADDLTRQALAGVMDAPLEVSAAWLEVMRTFFQKLNRPMPESNQIQAMIPRGATMLFNTCGTAAGIRATITEKVGGRFRSDTPFLAELFIVPGVPKEMKAMFTGEVLPWAKSRAGGAVILSRTLHTFGLGESALAERLGGLMQRGRNPSVGTTVSGGLVSLRVNARFGSLDQAQTRLDETVRSCHQKLGDLIFGQDEQTLQGVIAEMLLRPAGPIDAEAGVRPLTVATAESCTGGLLSKMLTDVPGSSAYFKMGFVTYSNKMKYERLGVSESILNTYGAVSEPVVDAMARAARRLAKADIALAVSGIAGPDGGSAGKPVGTVCLALAHGPSAHDTQTLLRTFTFSGDRETVRDRAAKMALTLLRYHLLARPLPF